MANNKKKIQNPSWQTFFIFILVTANIILSFLYYDLLLRTEKLETIVRPLNNTDITQDENYIPAYSGYGKTFEEAEKNEELFIPYKPKYK